MYLGHFALGFFAKPFLPRTSLGVLMLAPELADAIYFGLSLLGIELFQYNPDKRGSFVFDVVAPISHSLQGMCLWGLAYTLLYVLFIRKQNENASRLSVVLPLLVLSHWLLEIPVHRTWRDGVTFFMDGQPPKFGWNGFDYKWYSFVLELCVFIPGLLVYASYTTPIQQPTKFPSLMALAFIMISVHASFMLVPASMFSFIPNTIIKMMGFANTLLVIAAAHYTDVQRTVSTSSKTLKSMFAQNDFVQKLTAAANDKKLFQSSPQSQTTHQHTQQQYTRAA